MAKSMVAATSLRPHRWSRRVLLLATVVFAVLPAAFAGQTILGIKLDFGAVLVIFLALASFAKVLYAHEQATSQAARDMAAAGLAAKIRSGAADAFALYLRPFIGDGWIQIDNPWKSFRPSQFFSSQVETATTSLERVVTQTLEAILPVIAVGGHRGIGAGKVESSDWQAEFTNLALPARLIIFVPLLRSGTTFELSCLIANDLLAKVLLVMPPEGRLADGSTVSALWDQSRIEAAAFGLLLPSYRKEGLIFAAAGDPASLAISGCSPEEFVQFFRERLPEA